MKQLNRKYFLCRLLFLERLIQAASDGCDFATGFTKGKGDSGVGWGGEWEVKYMPAGHIQYEIFKE